MNIIVTLLLRILCCTPIVKQMKGGIKNLEKKQRNNCFREIMIIAK